MSERRIELLPLTKLVPAAKNPKRHQTSGIESSINRFGFVDPIILDERTGRIVSGHGRRESLLNLKQRGDQPPDGVTAQGGEWFIPVLRGWSSRSDQEAEAILLAENKLVEAGGWEDAELAEMLRGLEDAKLTEIGWSQEEIDQLLSDASSGTRGLDSHGVAPGGATAGPDAIVGANPGDDAEPPEVEAKDLYVKTGDLWTLGPHRILCGDSSVAEDIDRLFAGKKADMVATDPPFAIYGSSTGIGADIADDKMVRPFFEMVCKLVHRMLPQFGHAYVCTDWRSWAALWESAKRGGMTVKNMLVWDKGGGGLGSYYANCHELICYMAKLPPPTAMKSTTVKGARLVLGASNILRWPRVTGDERQHNAAKPVGMLSDLIEHSCEPGQVVADFFCGSGSTLMAAEKTGRVCYTLDIEPKEVQKTIERWKKLTGGEARRLDG